MNAWGKIGEVGNKIKSFTQVIEGQKYAFTDFLQRLASAVNRMIPDKEGRWIIIESLVFENVNAQWKRVIRPLKTRSATLEEWIWDTINIESHDHDDV